MFSKGLDCLSVGEAVAMWQAATTPRTDVAPVGWQVSSCTTDSNGVATSISVPVSLNGSVSWLGGAVVSVATDEWLGDGPDPAVFSAWFAFAFISTITLYWSARGIGMLIDLIEGRR